jgi:4-amino-4-deoxy-L-arabinose transferase-like glycosyltransferase
LQRSQAFKVRAALSDARSALGFHRHGIGTLVAIVAAGAAILCAAIGALAFPTSVIDPDTASYLFQAKLFAEGRIAADAPPDFGFSPSPHINIFNGLWASKYPFGNALFLTPGVLLGVPWLMPAIATGLTLLLFFLIVRKLFDARVASVALALAALSPTTLVMGSTLLSQPTSRLAIAVFLWSLLHALANHRIWRCAVFGILAGLALGYAFNTRPLVAVVVGVAALFLGISLVIRMRNWRSFFLAGATSLPALTLMLVAFFAWNASLTGDPLLLPYHALQTGDRMGFGLRGEGYDPYITDFRTVFTPAAALDRLWRHTLPCVLFNMVGWGNYIANMFLFSDPDRRLPFGAWLLGAQLLMIALPLARTPSRSDLFCAGIFLLTLVGLFFQYSDHAVWGTSPIHCSYYNEATLFGLIPLAARGILIVYDAATRRGWSPLWFADAGLVLILCSANVNSAIVRGLQNWNPYYQRLPQLIAAAGIHDAVVFIPGSRDAPVGEYPFVALDVADVVYFRTGPLPQWRIETGWPVALDRYFSERAVYQFDGSQLFRLEWRPKTE